MVALLALGIPGGAGTPIMLGAFAMHNVTAARASSLTTRTWSMPSSVETSFRP
jgi:TctA family transporter